MGIIVDQYSMFKRHVPNDHTNLLNQQNSKLKSRISTRKCTEIYTSSIQVYYCMFSMYCNLKMSTKFGMSTI